LRPNRGGFFRGNSWLGRALGNGANCGVNPYFAIRYGFNERDDLGSGSAKTTGCAELFTNPRLWRGLARKIYQFEFLLSLFGVRPMLVLSRKRDQQIIIGDGIVITVVEIRGDKVRLGIEAPTDVPVHRKEVYEAIKAHDSQTSSIKE
jgi:carbon storage regulator